jgi:hypothetical protein
MAASPFYNQIHTTKKYRLGTEKTDPSGNVWKYLKGVASLAAGDFVQYDKDGVTVRSTTTGPTSGAIAMSQSANTSATNYSWFLVAGQSAIANIATHSSGAGKGLFLSSTSGRLTSTPATEQTVVGAFTGGNAVSNVGAVQMVGRPVAPGDIST